MTTLVGHIYKFDYFNLVIYINLTSFSINKYDYINLVEFIKMTNFSQI